ncbi:hypothetical protein U1Q18_050774, partial [Sarracenia purpurea var. burkii]
SKKKVINRDVAFDEAFMLNQNKEDSVDDKSKKNITIEVDLHEDIFPSYSGEGGTNSQQYQQEVESKD